MIDNKQNQVSEKTYKYDLKVGTMKMGSLQIICIKDLSIRGDDLQEVTSDLQRALRAFNVILENANTGDE